MARSQVDRELNKWRVFKANHKGSDWQNITLEHFRSVDEAIPQTMTYANYVASMEKAKSGYKWYDGYEVLEVGPVR